MEKSYLIDNVERVYKIKYEKMTLNRQKIKSEVTPDSGEYGIEFLFAETEQEFFIAKNVHSWGNKELFENFAKCPKVQLTTIVEEVLADKYHNKDTLTTNEFNKSGGPLDNLFTRL